MDNGSSRNKSWQFHLIYTSFVFSLLYIFGLGIKLKLNISLQIFLVFIVSSIVKFLLINPLIFYALLAISFLGGFLVNHYISPFIFDFIKKAYFLFENIFANLQGKENIATDNIFLFWGLVIIIVSFLTAFILFKNKNIYWLPPIFIGSFIYYWYTFFDQAYFMASLFLLIFFILIGLDKYLKKTIPIKASKKYNFKINYASWVQTAILYSLLIVSLGILIPKTNNYIQWPWLQEKVYRHFPLVQNLRNYHDCKRTSEDAPLFDFSITGFQSESSRLGGPVILNDNKIMSVHANSPNYLRGNVKHKYTGNAWENVKNPWKVYQMNRDFSQLSWEDKNLYYEKLDITISNHYFASSTLFTPYKPARVNLTSNSTVRKNMDNILIFPQGVYHGESYKIQMQKPLPYGILLHLGIDRKKEDINNINTYLQIPYDKITERTKALVKEIVEDLEGDFEKAVAIENHLRQNYKYSLNVSQVPDNQEFIDYFLFHEKKGYCTYYATTMALMLRLEGIPSRYIEGYLAKDLVDTGIYQVKQKNAHAWVEAFIEPVGWMTFEATPGFPIESRLEGYAPIKASEDRSLKVDTGNNLNLESNIDDPIIYSDEEFIGGEISPNYEDISQESNLSLLKNIIIFIIGIFLFITPLRFLINLFIYKYKEKQISKLSNKEKVIYLYGQILNLMKNLGYPQNSGETHFEYANRIAYKFFNPKEKGIIEITEIFVQSKYGNSPTLDEDILILELYKNSLENNLKNHWGKKSYYYRKYVKTKIAKNIKDLF